MFYLTRRLHAVRLLCCVLLEYPSYPHPCHQLDDFTLTRNADRARSAAHESCRARYNKQDLMCHDRTSDVTGHDLCSTDRSAAVTLQLYRDDPSESCGVQLKQRRAADLGCDSGIASSTDDDSNDSPGSCNSRSNAHNNTERESCTRNAELSHGKARTQYALNELLFCPRVHRIDEQLCQASLLMRHLFPSGKPSDNCATVLRCVNGRAVTTMHEVQRALSGVQHITLQLQVQLQLNSTLGVDVKQPVQTAVTRSRAAHNMADGDEAVAGTERKHAALPQSRRELADPRPNGLPHEMHAKTELEHVHFPAAVPRAAQAIDGGQNAKQHRIDDIVTGVKEHPRVSDVWFRRRRAQPVDPVPATNTPAHSVERRKKSSNRRSSQSEKNGNDSEMKHTNKSNSSDDDDTHVTTAVSVDRSGTTAGMIAKRRGRPRKTAALQQPFSSWSAASSSSHAARQQSGGGQDTIVSSAHAHSLPLSSASSRSAHVYGTTTASDCEDAHYAEGVPVHSVTQSEPSATSIATSSQLPPSPLPVATATAATRGRKHMVQASSADRAVRAKRTRPASRVETASQTAPTPFVPESLAESSTPDCVGASVGEEIAL